ncbi:hypothetical protein F5Y18DRAFT_396306, partial [Xylariaceae sp. FL1019]
MRASIRFTLIAFAATPATSFQADSTVSCAWISLRLKLLPPEQNASSGAVITLSRYSDTDQPSLYNTSVSWADFEPYGTTPYENFTYTSSGAFTLNVSTLAAVNATWLPPDGEYNDPATLVVTLYTEEQGAQSPLYIEGTNATNSQTLLEDNLYCEVYLDDEGNYNGYYPGKPYDDDDVDNDSENDESEGKQIGIVVGSIVAAVIVVALIIWSIVRCDRRRSNRIAKALGRHTDDPISFAPAASRSSCIDTPIASRFVNPGLRPNRADNIEMEPVGAQPRQSTALSSNVVATSQPLSSTSMSFGDERDDEPPPSYNEANRDR